MARLLHLDTVMRFKLRAAPRYIAIALGLLGYAYLIDYMLALTLEQQHELSNAEDEQQAQLLAPDG